MASKQKVITLETLNHHPDLLSFRPLHVSMKRPWYSVKSTYRAELILAIVAKRCVLEQKLLLTAYRKGIWEIDWYQNEWLWHSFRGRLKVMSIIALQSTLNIAESVRDRGLVPKEPRYIYMTYGVSNSHATDDVTWTPKVKLVTPYADLRGIKGPCPHPRTKSRPLLSLCKI